MSSFGSRYFTDKNIMQKGGGVEEGGGHETEFSRS